MILDFSSLIISFYNNVKDFDILVDHPIHVKIVKVYSQRERKKACKIDNPM